MKRKKIVFLGTGWASFTVIKNLKNGLYDICVISPRNHFLFTPLLPSTTVGTIEFRSIIEPIRNASPGLRYIKATCYGVDPERKVVRCTDFFEGKSFEESFDFCVIAVGAESRTFDVDGVKEHAYFLKELVDARAIRKKIVDNFEHASEPNLSEEEKKKLLNFVVVGGGPTGVEFAAECSDFLDSELKKSYPDIIHYAHVTLLEGTDHILGSFDQKLSEYATQVFRRRRIEIKTNSIVRKITTTGIILDDGSSIDYGLIVWSTGNGPTSLIKKLDFKKDSHDRIITDDHLRVIGHDSIFSLGDCATLNGLSLPATSQVAMQEGKYLAKLLNGLAQDKNEIKPFRYRHLGMLAYVGGNRALADLAHTKASGFATWIFWRSAYLTRLVSLKNKVLVLFDWVKSKLFGRDVSTF